MEAALRAASRPRPRSRLTYLLPLASVLVPVIMVSGGGWLTWRSTWRDAATELIRSAETGAEYAARALESYAVAAGRMNERLRGLSDAQIQVEELALHHDLQAIVAELPQGYVGYVVDREGLALVATNLYPAQRGQSLADRDFFRALRAPDHLEVYVSEPFVGRFDGGLWFSLSRPRRNTGNVPAPEDGFDGITVVSVSPNILANGLRRLSDTPGDEMALVRQDGHILSYTTGMAAPMPAIHPARPFHLALGGMTGPVFVSEHWLPGSALVAISRAQGFPVIAVAIRPRSTIVRVWWERMISHLIFGVPATLALLALSIRVRRDQLRLSAANAGLERDFERSSDRLDRAHRFGMVGTFEYSPRSGANIRSAEYLAMHGLRDRETNELHEDWVRRLHPDDREQAEAGVLAALADPAVHEYSQMYRIITPMGETRWISASGLIERDDQGQAVVLRGAHVDVTPLRTTELALAESDARLRLAHEAVGIGTWEWVRRTRTLTWSRAMIELWGFDPALGQPILEAARDRLHRKDRLRVRRAVAVGYREGSLRCEFRVIRPRANGESETIWVVTRARLLRLAGEANPRLIGVAYDATESKRAEERAALLAHEVEHRAKNALTVVSSLLRMTTADSQEEYALVMEGRVRALARTMALLGEQRWKGAVIARLVEYELAPFGIAMREGGFDIAISGPEIMLPVDAAQPLSMALHELATNAAKYGSLSVPGGRLEVRWRVEGERIHLLWEETGGPLLEGPPPRQSFGTLLIASIFEGQLGGQIIRRWETAGLVCEVTFPLTPA